MLLERTSDAVVLFERQGIVRYANQAVEAVFGRTPAEVTGAPFELLMAERMRELDRRLIETWGLHRDSHEIPAELSLSNLGDDSDRQFSAIIRDVSERFLFYSREMSAALSERLSIESMLRRALEREEFALPAMAQ